MTSSERLGFNFLGGDSRVQIPPHYIQWNVHVLAFSVATPSCDLVIVAVIIIVNIITIVSPPSVRFKIDSLFRLHVPATRKNKN